MPLSLRVVGRISTSLFSFRRWSGLVRVEERRAAGRAGANPVLGRKRLSLRGRSPRRRAGRLRFHGVLNRRELGEHRIGGVRLVLRGDHGNDEGEERLRAKIVTATSRHTHRFPVV
jgi:hypothetical protein